MPNLVADLACFEGKSPTSGENSTSPVIESAVSNLPWNTSVPASLQLCLSAAQIVGCAFQLRLETQRRFKFGNAFQRFAGGEQSQTQIVVSLGAVGIEPKRFVKLLDGLWYSAR